MAKVIKNNPQTYFSARDLFVLKEESEDDISNKTIVGTRRTENISDDHISKMTYI